MPLVESVGVAVLVVLAIVLAGWWATRRATPAPPAVRPRPRPEPVLGPRRRDPGRESNRQARLLDLTRGPADWANAAAMVALFDVATREPATRAEIREALLALTRIEMTPPRYQHVMRPAALVLRELGDLDRETARALDELIHPPEDDEE